MRVLVAYASRHGATRGIAERIAATLAAEGVEAVVQPIGRAGDVRGYGAFVIGSATYLFHWLGEATAFVRRNAALLANRPVWLFSSGPVGTATVDEQGRDILEQCKPREYAELKSRVHPRDARVFFGAYDAAQKPIGLAERITRLLPASKDLFESGDFRDWPAIEAWARGIASELEREPGLPGRGQVAAD